MMKMKLQSLLLVVTAIGLGILACQPSDSPDPAPSPFIVTAKVILGVADLKPNQLVNDINLTWTRDKAQVSDSIKYTIFYKDTLAKNLTDTTFTINNVGENVTVTGLVIATTNKGRTTASPFSVTTGLAPHVRIKKWTRESMALRYYNITTYTYDSLGRLASFFHQDAKQCCTFYQPGQRTVLKYDQLGRLISAEGLPNGDNTGSFENYLYTYDYDDHGNLKSIKYYSTTYQKPPLTLRYTLDFELNGTPFPTSYTTGTGLIFYKYINTYKNGNIIQIDRFDYQGNKLDPIVYQYDTSPNPFYGLLHYAVNPDLTVIFSKNAVIGSNIVATYNPNGTINKRESSKEDRTEWFEYESY